VNNLSGIANLPTIRSLDPTSGGGTKANSRPAHAEPTGDRGVRDRYRVDAAYRSYQRTSAPTSPRDVVGGRPGLRKFSSADMLDTMIHQMGGGLTSSAKGTFVDIAV